MGITTLEESHVNEEQREDPGLDIVTTKTEAATPSRRGSLVAVLLSGIVIGIVAGYYLNPLMQRFDKPALLSAVEEAGFGNAVYYPATDKTAESVTAKTKSCMLNFIFAEHGLTNGTSIRQLAAVNANGSFVFDLTIPRLETSTTCVGDTPRLTP